MQNGIARFMGLGSLSLHSIETVDHEVMVHKQQEHVDRSLS